jgi:hypothetical protein
MRYWLKTIFATCWSQLLDETRGAELIEFAVSLPLMMVFAIGIYDFSSAFILKQKIAQIASNAARVAANQPMSEVLMTGNCPSSICAIRDVVHQALTNNGIDDCGLHSSAGSRAGGTLIWTFTASGGTCSGTLSLKIDRGDTYPAALQPPFQAPYTIEATKVTLSYPYQWQFNKVITLIAPGANFANSAVQSIAVVQNLN